MIKYYNEMNLNKKEKLNNKNLITGMLNFKQRENSHLSDHSVIRVRRAKIFFAIILSFVIFLPFIASAFQIVPVECTGSNPEACNFDALMSMINSVLNVWFPSIALSIAAITFSIAGAKILMKPDNPEEIKKAKSMFTNTVKGMIIILVAWLVVHTVISTLVKPSIDALRFFK